MKPLYAMTGIELAAAAESAEANGDQRRARQCREQMLLLATVANAFACMCFPNEARDEH